jgi:light-independent protochlorophyllide reductase subunit B
MGFGGADVLFDTWVHPLVMGLEEHLLRMFSEDFEFHNDARPSHLGAGTRVPSPAGDPVATQGAPPWSDDAERTLKRVPFFVRGKVRRNTETYAIERGIVHITSETLYEAKAHYGR